MYIFKFYIISYFIKIYIKNINIYIFNNLQILLYLKINTIASYKIKF